MPVTKGRVQTHT